MEHLRHTPGEAAALCMQASKHVEWEGVVTNTFMPRSAPLGTAATPSSSRM